MSIPIPDFWRLLVESRLASAEQARQLQEMFINVSGGGQAHANAVALAQWMTTNGLLSPYQAKVLLSGRAGPFVFGDYLLYDRFEPGRFKSTFRAVNLATHERVLVSFHSGPVAQIQREWWNVAEQTARFREAVHPHLSRVLGLVDSGQYKFTVLDDLEGQSAAQRLAGGPIPWQEACRIVQQVAAGLSRLAELRLLHGEICPANIWIDPHGSAKLLLPPLAHDPSVIPGPIDFLEPDPSGRLLMLADYAAPELSQAPTSERTGCSPNWRTEVYALGCTLYHLMSGRAPFTGDDVSAKLMQHAGAEPVAPLESFGVPPWVAQVVSQIMDKDVMRRFQNPQQVVQALGALLQPTSEPARPQLATPPPTAAPDLPTLQPLPPLDMSGGGKQTAGTGPGHSPIEFPSVEVGPDNFGFFDAIAAPPGRNRRARKSGGLHVATWILLLCVIGGAIFLASAAMKKDDRSKAGATSAGAAKPATDANQAQAADEKDAEISESSDSAASAEAGDENGEAPAAAGGPARADSDSRGKPAAQENTALWASPTRGSPVSVDYVPPGAQAFLFVRPADLLRPAEGEKILAALGPYGESARQHLEAMAGAPLAEVEQLTVAWVERMSADNVSTIAPIYIFRFANAVDQDKLKARWKSAASTTHGGEVVFATPTGSAYLPTAERGKTLIAGAAEEVEESAEQGAVAPPLRRAIEKMLVTTDANRQIVFLFAPSFLFQEHKYFFAGELEKLRPPMQAFFGDECRAAMLSAHLTKDNLFIEFCALGSVGQSPEIVTQQFRERMAKLPEAAASGLAALDPQPYGKKVLLRYPEMLRVLAEFTRAAAQNDQAVLRCYLPAQAAHNLLMGSELALAEAASSPAGRAAGAAAKQPESVAQKLQHVTSLIFTKETLERALQLLGDDIAVEIEILGGDLQLEGITKNQTFGLDEKNEPAREILRKIMSQANPDGKLVYVVKPRAPGAEEMLFITTRKAAEKRGDKLPPELDRPKGK